MTCGRGFEPVFAGQHALDAVAAVRRRASAHAVEPGEILAQAQAGARNGRAARAAHFAGDGSGGVAGDGQIANVACQGHGHGARQMPDESALVRPQLIVAGIDIFVLEDAASVAAQLAAPHPGSATFESDGGIGNRVPAGASDHPPAQGRRWVQTKIDLLVFRRVHQLVGRRVTVGVSSQGVGSLGHGHTVTAAGVGAHLVEAAARARGERADFSGGDRPAAGVLHPARNGDASFAKHQLDAAQGLARQQRQASLEAGAGGGGGRRRIVARPQVLDAEDAGVA